MEVKETSKLKGKNINIFYRGEIFGKWFINMWSVGYTSNNSEKQQGQRHDWL